MSKIKALKLKNILKRELRIIDTLDVLKQIAISEYRSMEKEKHEASRFTLAVETFFRFYRESAPMKRSLFIHSDCQTPAVIAVGSDEGFLGVLNNQVIEKTVEFCRAHPGACVVAMGRRTVKKLDDAGLKVDHELPGISLPLTYHTTLPLKSYLMKEYLSRRIGSATVIYAQCHSFTRQSLAVKRLLPFDASDLEARSRAGQVDKDFLYVEPDVISIIEYTIALWFGRKLYEIFWDSKLSEVANRAIELNERFDSLSRSNTKTKTRYFRASHEVIDEGIREIFASQHFAKKLEKKMATSHMSQVTSEDRDEKR